MATPSPSIEAARESLPADVVQERDVQQLDVQEPDAQALDASRGSPPQRAVHGQRFSWSGIAGVAVFGCIRLAFAGFLFLTSLYCLLVWVPFTYFGFIRNPLLSWLPLFVQMHAAFYGVLLGAVAITLIPALRRDETRRAAAGFLLVNTGVCLNLWRTHALSALQPDLQSYFWSVLSLLPLAWLATLDLAVTSPATAKAQPACESPGAPRSGRQAPNESLNAPLTVGWRRNFFRAAFAALLVSTAFAATSVLRAAASGNPLPAKLALQGFALSLCFHLAIFVPVALIVSVIAWVSVAAVLTRAFAALLIFQALRTMILPTISFGGTMANIFAAVVALVAVFFATGLAASLRSRMIDAGTGAIRISPAWSWSAFTIALLAAAYGIPSILGRTDWDFVVEKVAVLLLWLAALHVVRHLMKRRWDKTASIAAYGLVCLAGLGFLGCARAALYNPDPSPAWQTALDNYAGADISFKTAYAVLSRPVDDKAYLQFYEFLKQHTNLPRSVNVAPPDVRLVADLQPTPGTKPNIFVFVIDSLRQDYISPYNPDVDYTPQIGSFARDSVVLKNSFTRYGGTALSEPAIWVGAMQLHKQYIEPFYPMNNLWKLLATDGYHSYISVDPILSMMLPSSPALTELDHDNKDWANLDFVPTLKELEAKIDARADRNQPIFAYTQPQNVHTMTLQRSKIKGGRKAVNIYELRRMDAAFGEFVAFLQQRGLYDNSIIILTADHGDCYGEFGRWGHSDFMVPQIIRIPLIVHLPPRMQKQFVWDADAPAFTTDITPSLYYLLGHRPLRNDVLFGRPLFTESRQERLAYDRPNYLLVASYAPVYAMLSGDARSLFIVDAVNSKNYYYDLAQDPTGSRSHVTIPIQKQNEALIRHDVGLIDDLYGWHPSDAGR
jgi:phosphoglycerol transferase MdoB-like AlkP superfamily enzyme